MNKVLMLKLLALEEFGVAGERENAKKALDRLLLKHNITRDFFKSEERTVRKFSYMDKLIVAVLYWVLDSLGDEIKPFSRKGQRGIFCKLNDFEFTRAKNAYSTWKKALKEELELTFVAFLAKNRIFSSLSNVSEPKTDFRRIAKIQARSEQIQRVQVDKALLGVVRSA